MASILVVDDDSSILYFLSEALGRTHNNLTLANSGKEALKHLEEKEFDLIVSDLQMPEVNGIDVLQAGKEKYPNIEVLILTAYGSIKSAVRAMKLGAFEYLSKPVDVEELRLKVAQALEHRQMRIKIGQQQKEIDEHHEMIQRDLELAEQVQNSLVPVPIINEKINVGVNYLPMIGVGGDFVDIYSDGEQFVYITIIDITGHGISAALLVNRICSEIRTLIRDEFEPNEILFKLNNFIIDIFHRTGMFLTMFASKINLKTNIFTYAGSAHPALILWKENKQEIVQLASQNLIIGFDKQDENIFAQDNIQLDSGDKIIYYTDGIIDAENSNKENLGYQRLLKIIEKLHTFSATKLTQEIISDMKASGFDQIRDDIFLVAAEMK